MGVEFVVDKSTYLLKPTRNSRENTDHYFFMFSDVKSFEAILNLLHTLIYKNALFTFRLVEIFSNLPPHQTTGIS
jgi:hypothetical protein